MLDALPDPGCSRANHAELKEMIDPHLFLRDQGCIKSPDTVYEEINPTVTEQPSLFFHRKLNMRQKNR